MTIRIHIPANLREFTEGQSIVEVGGASVKATLTELNTRFPDLRDKLLSSSDELHSFVNVFVDGRSIRDLQGLGTPLTAGDTLLIVPALAGG